MNLNGRISVGITFVGSKTVGLDVPTDLLDEFLVYSWANGTGADQANQSFHRTGTIGISGSVSYRLVTAGALTDAFGDVVNLARLKMIYVKNTHATQPFVVSGDLMSQILGGGDGTVTLGPGAMYLHAVPDATAWALLSGTFDTITLTNGLGSTTAFDLAVLGVAA